MAQEENSPSKFNGRTKIIAIAVVLILAASGGTYFYTSTQAQSAARAAPATEEPKLAVYFPLETFTATISSEDMDGILQVDITLRMGSQKDADIIKEATPEVRDRILMLMSELNHDDVTGKEARKKLAKRISDAISPKFSNDAKISKAPAVLFTSFVVQ